MLLDKSNGPIKGGVFPLMKLIFRTSTERMRLRSTGQLKKSAWNVGHLNTMSWLGGWKFWSRWIDDEYESKKKGPEPR